MGLRDWVSRDEQEHAWLLDMHRRLTPYSRRASAVFVAFLAVCAPWLSPWSILPVAGADLAFGLGALTVDRRQRLDLLVVGWFVAQTLLTVSIVVNGRQHVGDLAVLMFMAIGAAGGFATRVVAVCTAYTALLMVVAGLGFDGHVVIDDPPRLLIPLAMLFSTQILASAARRASIEHRASAVLDPLTGLLNRAALDARSAFPTAGDGRGEQPLGVLLIDIDAFKDINDTHGHAGGDDVLRSVTEAIRSQIRAYDSAYRLGGDEFLILAPGLESDSLHALGERVRRAANAVAVGGRTISISVGVASARPHERLADAIVDADAALYASKRAGRNRVSTAGVARPA